VLGRIDEGGHALAAVVRAPDQGGIGVRLELLVLPVGVEAGDHLVHFMAMAGHDGVVAGQGQVAWLPVQGFDISGFIVDHHRLLVRQREGRVAVAHLDAGVNEFLAGLLVLRFAAAPRRVEHDAHLDAALVRGDHRVDQGRIGEQEHPDVERLLRAGNRVDQRRGGVVRQNEQFVGHGVNDLEVTGIGLLPTTGLVGQAPCHFASTVAPWGHFQRAARAFRSARRRRTDGSSGISTAIFSA
jgi:hypothetical protein